MSSTNKTVNYKLSQFIGTDKPTFLGDYNNDMQIIDDAIFEANQSAEQALNDVEAVKGAQAELKNVHTETQEQVAQLKETADGMTGDVTAAQEAANSAEQKATEAQTAATNVVNAANAASANATKAKQTADGNKTTLAELTQRVEALEGAPKAHPIKIGKFYVRMLDGGTESEQVPILTVDITNYNLISLTLLKSWNYCGVIAYADTTKIAEIPRRTGGSQGDVLKETISNVDISHYSTLKIVYTKDSTGAFVGYENITISA